MLPLSYSIRNLLRTPSRTIQLIGGSALVITLIMTAAAFNRGMDKSLQSSGNPDNVILLSAGSESSAERSQISPNVPSIASASIRGIRQYLGKDAVSGEIHYMGYCKDMDGNEYDVNFRGVRLAAMRVHRHVSLIDGHFPGVKQVMVGRMAWKHLGMPEEALTVGKTIMFEGHPFEISGVFAAPGSTLESEVWIGVNDLMTLTKRDSLSCAVITLDDATFDDVDLFTKQRLDLELSAVREVEYYKKLSTFFDPIKLMTWITALLIGSGAIFGGLNTMYAAYIARKRELATLQAVGYGRTALFICILEEALVANIIGATFAIAAVLLLLDRYTVSFSTGIFHLTFDGPTLILGLISACCLAIIGAVVPAWNCLKPPLVETIR